MKRSILQSIGSLFFVALCVSSSFAQTWELPAIQGDQKAWGTADDNWTWDRGNPLGLEDGTHWSVEMQTAAEPTLTSEYVPMEQGLLYNFVRAWTDGSEAFDPDQFYHERSLTTMSSSQEMGKFPENSKSSVVIFAPGKPGTFHVHILGKVNVQNKAAGHAALTVYTLASKRTVESQIDQQMCNAPQGEGGFPERFEFDRDVELADGQEFVLRIQTISPGQAPAGRSSIDFEKFSVVRK
jgi:hypothetical protein